MKNTDLQKYNSFKKRHGLCYTDIVGIVTEYAYSEYEYAVSYFSEKYNISDSSFYKCRDFAVICHLVDDKTCERLKEKAGANLAVYSKKNSPTISYRHYSKLAERREAFLSTFSKEEITDISQKYSEGISLRVISNEYEICEESVKKLLKIGIVNLIIPSDLVYQIKLRVSKEGKNVDAISRMEEKRQKNKLKKVEPLKKESEILIYQIDKYDSYFMGDEVVPDKEFLIKRLEEVKKKYQSILEF